LIYIVCTYCPLIYVLAPFLGVLKIVLLAGVVMLISFVATMTQYTNSTAYKHATVYWWGIFVILVTAGLFVSVDRGATLELVQLNLKCFFVFLVMVRVVDSMKRLEVVLRVFVASGICMAGSAVYKFFMNPDGLGSSDVARLTGGFRAIALEKGIFGDPNDLALLLNSTLPFALFFLYTAKRKVLSFVGVIMLIAGTIVTHSRAGFLGLCLIGLSCLFVFWGKHKNYAFVFIAVVVGLWAVSPESYKARIATLTAWGEDEVEKTERMSGWSLALKDGLEHPLLGQGAGTSVYVMGGGLGVGTRCTMHLLK
jgi:O-Antigen ligase